MGQDRTSQVALVVKNLPANAGDTRDMDSFPGSGRSPRVGNGNPLHILAWEIPWTEEPGGLQPIGLQRVRYDRRKDSKQAMGQDLGRALLRDSHLGPLRRFKFGVVERCWLGYHMKAYWTEQQQQPDHHILKTAAAAAKLLQSCPTPCDPTDCSLPGSSIHGIFQARVLEWGDIAFSDSQNCCCCCC